jgi:hypothetical protein
MKTSSSENPFSRRKYEIFYERDFIFLIRLNVFLGKDFSKYISKSALY